MYERLTVHTPDNFGYAEYQLKRGIDDQDAIRRLAVYEDSGLSPEEVQELAKAKAEGRLVVLPCKTGDTVYKADFGDGFSEPKVYERIIRGFKHTTYANYPFCDIEQFGKTVFLTREEAEKVLEGSKC